jgi:hypothetical protein
MWLFIDRENGLSEPFLASTSLRRSFHVYVDASIGSWVLYEPSSLLRGLWDKSFGCHGWPTVTLITLFCLRQHFFAAAQLDCSTAKFANVAAVFAKLMQLWKYSGAFNVLTVTAGNKKSTQSMDSLN